MAPVSECFNFVCWAVKRKEHALGSCEEFTLRLFLIRFCSFVCDPGFENRSAILQNHHHLWFWSS